MAPQANSTAASRTEATGDSPTWNTSPRDRVPFLRDMERRDHLFDLVYGLRSLFLTGMVHNRGKLVAESEEHILWSVNHQLDTFTWVKPSPTGGYTLAKATAGVALPTAAPAASASAPSSAPAPAPAPAATPTGYATYGDIPAATRDRYTIDPSYLRDIDRSGINQIGA